MFYPFKLKSIYIEKLWGGTNLNKYLKDVPKDKKIGESWETCVREDYSNLIKNGSYADTSLKDIIQSFGKKITGNSNGEFPLFLKLIDANRDLSVQVHPDDKYAKENEKEKSGKDESWVILYSKPGAKIVYGIKDGIGKETFKRAIYDGEVEKYLNYVEVKPGEVYNIYPGLVHALGEGIVVAEIQQNSNTTYRVYDYNREDENGNLRELHIDKALDVIKYKKKYDFIQVPGVKIPLDDIGDKTIYVNNDYYSLEKYNISGEIELEKDNQFFIYFVTEGKGIIKYAEDREILINKGDTLFIPASMSNHIISGSIQFLLMKTASEKKDFIEKIKKMIPDNIKVEKRIVL